MIRNMWLNLVVSCALMLSREMRMFPADYRKGVMAGYSRQPVGHWHPQIQNTGCCCRYLLGN
jgi:hypothetical protein